MGVLSSVVLVHAARLQLRPERSQRCDHALCGGVTLGYRASRAIRVARRRQAPGCLVNTEARYASLTTRDCDRGLPSGTRLDGDSMRPTNPIPSLRKATVWRNKISSVRTAADGGVVDWARAKQYCREHDLVGVGYGVAGLDESAPLTAVLEHWRNAGWGMTPIHTITRLAKQTQIGDFVWNRDGSAYWLGQIQGGWHYDPSDGAEEFDLYNVRPCQWVATPFDGWEVPGAVVRSFSGRGATLQRVLSIPAGTETELLWRRATDPSAGRGTIDAAEVLTGLLDPTDVEDVVLLYLQYQGWLLMPSTRMRDTPVYEAAFRHREDARTAIVSVKSGHTPVPLAPLAAAARDGEAFAFSTENAFEGEPSDFGVNIISVESVVDFMETHAALLPLRVARWLQGP
jgi:hypothetical protein